MAAFFESHRCITSDTRYRPAVSLDDLLNSPQDPQVVWARTKRALANAENATHALLDVAKMPNERWNNVCERLNY
ncbi:MAG: hypothetical protein U0894_01690 [Pirellulales bacterium]